MARIELFITLALVATALGAPPQGLDGRIVGGSTASNGQFPYQVSLRQNNRHFCGGSIINNYYILTAAHCLYGQSAANVVVVVGTNYLNSGGVAYRASQLKIHGSYNPNTMQNDIALIRVASPIQYNNVVRAIALSSGSTGGNVPLTLSGWGSTYLGSASPNSLQYAYLRSYDNNQCAAALASYGSIYSSQICSFTQYGQGACHGDSGGPLVLTGGAQVGIVSWGAPCAIGKPDVYTRVSSFYSWIQANAQ